MEQEKLITLYSYEYYNKGWNTSDLNWSTWEFLTEYLGAGLYHPNVKIISREFSKRQILTYYWRFPEDVVTMVKANLL